MEEDRRALRAIGLAAEAEAAKAAREAAREMERSRRASGDGDVEEEGDLSAGPARGRHALGPPRGSRYAAQRRKSLFQHPSASATRAAARRKSYSSTAPAVASSTPLKDDDASPSPVSRVSSSESELAHPEGTRSRSRSKSRHRERTSPQDPTELLDLPPLKSTQINVGIIGLGRMGRFIARQFLQLGHIPPERLYVSSRNIESIASDDVFANSGVHILSSNAKVAAAADVLILAVLPTHLNTVASQIAKHLRPEVVVVSLLAGVPVEKVAQVLRRPQVLRTSLPPLVASKLRKKRGAEANEEEEEDELCLSRAQLAAMGVADYVLDLGDKAALRAAMPPIDYAVVTAYLRVLVESAKELCPLLMEMDPDVVRRACVVALLGDNPMSDDKSLAERLELLPDAPPEAIIEENQRDERVRDMVIRSHEKSMTAAIADSFERHFLDVLAPSTDEN